MLLGAAGMEERKVVMMGRERDQFPVGMRVLAVDDDPVCLKVLETLLRRCRYHGEHLLDHPHCLLLYYYLQLILLSLFGDVKNDNGAILHIQATVFAVACNLPCTN